MKFVLPIRAALVAFATVSLLSAQEATPPAAAPAPAPQFSDSQVLETLGWFVGRQAQLSELAFSPSEIDSILVGFKRSMAGQEAPYALESIRNDFQTFMQTRQAAASAKKAIEGRAKSEAFMAGVKAKPGVIVLPSGLAYEIVQPGQGDKPKPTDTVKVHYTGTLVDGTVFDSSVQRGEPAEFRLDQVIPGWTEGLQQINKGGKIKLYIPSDLGYGDEGNQSIPPASLLVFDVELLDINPPQAAAPVEAVTEPMTVTE